MRASGRAPGNDAEGQVGVTALGDERRQRGGEQDHRQERAEAHQQGGEGQERQNVLDEVEAAVDDLQAAPVGLAAGVLQLVVVLGVLEVSQVELERLADDARVDAQVEARVQHVFGQAASLADGGLPHQENEFSQPVGAPRRAVRPSAST